MKKILFITTLCCAFSFLLQAEQSSSEFMKGYIYSKLEDKFCDSNIEVDIDSNEIVVYSWPDNLECREIESYLQTVCPGCSVQFNSNHQVCDRSFENGPCETNLGAESFEEGGFLPELNAFFPTMLAQPHILGYSVGYRSYDRVFKSTLPVSIGDQFSLYQFKINSCARLYFGIEACVWAIFEAKTKSLSLINADYFIALPLTYINNNFSTRLRIFHQSSHLGDEFLLETPRIVRVNPSMEGIDLSIAYDFDRLVCFMGYTHIIRSDDSYKVKPNSVYYGFNLFLDFAKIQTFHVEGTPYIATYVENNENNHWNFDSTVAVGYQWNKSYGRKLRIFVKGHDGYSAEGQFSRHRSNYVSINLLYGY